MGIRRRGHPVCSSARSTRNVIRSAEIHLREACRFLTVRLIVIIIPTAALSVLSPDVNHSPTRTNWSTSSQEPRHKKLDIQRNTTTTTQETSPHTKYYPKGDTIFIVPGTSLPSKDTIVRDTPPDHRPRYQAPRKTLPHKTPPNKPSPFNTAVKETPSSDHPQGINCSTMERDLDNLLDEIRRGSSSATTPAKNGPRGNSTTRSVTGSSDVGRTNIYLSHNSIMIALGR